LTRAAAAVGQRSTGWLWLPVRPVLRRPGAGRALDDLDVEPDRQQVLHVERARGDVAHDEVLEVVDAAAVILLLEPLAATEHLVDVLTRVHEETEVVECG